MKIREKEALESSGIQLNFLYQFPPPQFIRKTILFIAQTFEL
ncbi:MAG: hypothetical protein ACI9YL_001769 [Luteibaculaceae bacterium]|jgi:hypothetical protein